MFASGIDFFWSVSSSEARAWVKQKMGILVQGKTTTVEGISRVAVEPSAEGQGLETRVSHLSHKAAENSLTVDSLTELIE